MLFKPVFRICVYNREEDVFVSRSIIDTGSYEPKVSLLLRELLSIWPETGGQKTVVLDIGANLGIYGLYVAKLGFKVWAVEPQVANLMKVWKTIFYHRLTNLFNIEPAIHTNHHILYHL